MPPVDALIRPSSVAVVGASNDPARIGGRPLDYMRRYGFAGKVFAVNPKYTEVQGLPCAPSIEELPEGVDLYIFAVPAPAVPELLEQACRRGARAATIFAGGFAETDAQGIGLQQRITDLASEYGVAVNGPNCLGVISFVHRNFATFSTALTSLDDPAPGTTAIVSQSGGFATNLCVEAGLVGARFSHVITTGNEAGLDFPDYLDFLAGDDDTTAILGYMEGIRDGSRLTKSLARARQAGKRVFLTKVGRTDVGAEVVATHTALASGIDASYDAVFRRYGVTRLHSIDELIDVARAHSVDRSASEGLVVATISGGTAVYIADTCQALGIELVQLSHHTGELLAKQMPEFGFRRNPVDLTAQLVNDLPSLRRVLDTLHGDPGAQRILLFLGGQESHSTEIIDELTQTSAHEAGRLSVAWLGIPEDIRRAARQRGLDVHADPVRFLRGIALARPLPVDIRTEPVEREREPVMPELTGPKKQDLVPQSGRLALDEWGALALLDQAGLRTPARALVSDEAGLQESVDAVGFPCVLKLLRPFVAHRSAVGAVKLGIGSWPELRQAWRQLENEHGALAALLEAQAPAGLEVIIGVLRDPGFYARMVISAGGVDVDRVTHRVTITPPFDPAVIRQEASTLQLWDYAAPAGVAPAQALEHVVEAAERIGTLFTRLHDQLDEIECNPVIINRDGVTIVDALGFCAEANDR